MAKVAVLSARTVQTLRKPGMYLDGRGLYLRIGPGGNKSWIYRFALDGKTRDMGLGPSPDISLAEARERAAAQRKLRLDGTDPIAARQAGRQQAKLDAAKTLSFKECAERYIASHEAGWKNPKHASQWPATLGAYAYPVLGKLPVHAVDVGLVMKASNRSGQRSPKQRAGCVAGLKASSIGRRRAAIARERTRQDGRDIWKTFFRLAARLGASSIMRPCPMPR
jgi:Arm DNA-binding domain